MLLTDPLLFPRRFQVTYLTVAAQFRRRFRAVREQLTSGPRVILGKVLEPVCRAISLGLRIIFHAVVRAVCGSAIDEGDRTLNEMKRNK